VVRIYISLFTFSEEDLSRSFLLSLFVIVIVIVIVVMAEC